MISKKVTKEIPEEIKNFKMKKILLKIFIFLMKRKVKLKLNKNVLANYETFKRLPALNIKTKIFKWAENSLFYNFKPI